MAIWNDRIKALRENTGVTLKDMANIIGVSEATVQRYESGKIDEIPYKAIIAYAKKFNVDPGYIMGWGGPRSSTMIVDLSNFDMEDIDLSHLKTHSKSNTYSKEEMHIIECYRKLSDQEKEMIKRMLKYEETINKKHKDNKEGGAIDK